MTEQLPHSIDHERQVLCSAMLDPENLAEAADMSPYTEMDIVAPKPGQF